MSFRLFALTIAIAAMAIPLTAADADPRLERLKKLIPRVDLRKFLDSKRPGSPIVRILPPAAEGDTCAHILMYLPPANVDKGIQQFHAPSGQDKAPSTGGQITPMPVCPQDVRQLKLPD